MAQFWIATRLQFLVVDVMPSTHVLTLVYLGLDHVHLASSPHFVVDAMPSTPVHRHYAVDSRVGTAVSCVVMHLYCFNAFIWHSQAALLDSRWHRDAVWCRFDGLKWTFSGCRSWPRAFTVRSESTLNLQCLTYTRWGRAWRQIIRVLFSTLGKKLVYCNTLKINNSKTAKN